MPIPKLASQQKHTTDKMRVPTQIRVPYPFVEPIMSRKEQEIWGSLQQDPGFLRYTDPSGLPRAGRLDWFFGTYQYPEEPNVRHRGYDPNCYLGEAKYFRATIFASSALMFSPKRMTCDGSCAAWHSVICNYIIRREVCVPSDFTLVTNQFRGCEPPSLGGCILPSSSPFRSLAACAAAHHEAYDFGNPRAQTDSRWERIREMHIYALKKARAHHSTSTEADSLLIVAAVARRLEPVSRMAQAALTMVGELNSMLDKIREELATEKDRATTLEAVLREQIAAAEDDSRDAANYRLLVTSLQERNPDVPTDSEASDSQHSTSGWSSACTARSAGHGASVLDVAAAASEVSVQTFATIDELTATLASHSLTDESQRRLGSLIVRGMIIQDPAWEDARI